MKVLQYSMLLFFLSTGMSSPLLGQYDAQRTTNKTFPISNDGELTLNNRYGDVIITGWEKDSIKIKMDVQVKKKSKYDAEELLDRIELNAEVYGRYVTISTEIQEKSNSFFGRLFSEINPIDFDKSDVDIDYEIHVPQNMSIELKNYFGDLILTDWSGELKVELKHGDLKITDAISEANLNVTFGSINARRFSNAYVALKNGKLKVQEADDLKISSSGSEINLRQVNFLDIKSSKDEFQIDQVTRIKGEVKYSTLFIDQVDKEIFLDLNLADIRVAKITNSDCLIYLKENNSEVDINIAGLSLDMKADLEGGTLRLPSSTANVDTKVLDEKNKIRQVTASYGSGAKGRFTLDGKKGYVILREL